MYIIERLDLFEKGGSYESPITALDNLFYVKDKYNLQTKAELRLLMSKFTIKENIRIVDFIAERYSSVEYTEEINYRTKTSKEKGDVCKRCKYYHECEGLQKRYVDRYGFSDLVPIE